MSFIAEEGFVPASKKILIKDAPGMVRDSMRSRPPASVRARSTREVTDFSISTVGRPGYEKKLATTGFLKSGRMSVGNRGSTVAPSRQRPMASAEMR